MTRPRLLALVAWSEIVAGGFMLLDVAGNLVGAHGRDMLTLNKGLFIVLGLLSLFAGIALRRSSTVAWRGSVLLQLCLMPVLLIGSVAYRPGLGAFIPVGVNLPVIGSASLLSEFSIGVDFAALFGTAHGPQYIALNLAATALLLILLFNRPARPEA